MIGMLWYNPNQKADLAEKVEQAASYYAKKYGQQPTVCFVHPRMVTGDGISVNGISVRSMREILPNHFWLGVDEQPAAGKPPRSSLLNQGE